MHRFSRVVFVLLLALALRGVTAWAQAPDSPAPSVHRALNVVFIGDSITEGAGTNHRDTEAAPVVCGRVLGEILPGGAAVYSANVGRSGHTTVDFLPGGEDFATVERATTHLTAAHPEARLIFSIMLGTNDSANVGPNGAPVSTDQYRDNLTRLTDALVHAHPACLIFLHRPIWYSANTHNTSDYEGPASARLRSYFPVIDALAASDAAGVVRRLHPGDTRGYDHFAAAYQNELAPEHGRSGVFYLHPNTQGAEALGKLWAEAIAREISR